MTKTSEGTPSPNQISARGNKAIAGTGLNIAVKVDSKSDPTLVDTAMVVNNAAKSNPAA